MASESVPDAFISKYATSIYTAGQSLPLEIWLGKVPALRADQTTVSLPTIVLRDNGMTIEYDLEENPQEITTLTLIVRAVTLPAADAIAKRLKYGGGSISAGSGFDFTTSLPFSSGIRLYTNGCVRTAER